MARVDENRIGPIATGARLTSLSNPLGLSELMFSRQLVDAVTEVLPSRRGKDGRGRPRLARLYGRKSELEGKKEREGGERRGRKDEETTGSGWTKQQRPRAPTCV